MPTKLEIGGIVSNAAIGFLSSSETTICDPRIFVCYRNVEDIAKQSLRQPNSPTF